MSKLVNTSCPICGSKKCDIVKIEVMNKEIFRQQLIEQCNEKPLYKVAKFVSKSGLNYLANTDNIPIDKLIEDLSSKLFINIADAIDPIETIYEIRVYCKDCGFQIM